jgi:hypothetical protein
MALAGVALLYPLTLVARLTPRGAELAARSGEFVFVGLAFVVALVLTTIARRTVDAPERDSSSVRTDHIGLLALVAAHLGRPGARLSRRRAHAGLVAVLLLLSLGGAALSIPLWARMPGDYLVAADPRSVEPKGIAAATWTAQRLGREQVFMSDRTNRVLLATYGRQHPVSTAGDRVDLKPAYFQPQLGGWELDLLRRLPVRYVIADQRLTRGLPHVGVYVERGELAGQPAWTSPMPASALAKWDIEPGSDRIYDGGDIRIYDIWRISGARP